MLCYGVDKVFVYTAMDNETGSSDTEKVFGIFKSANYSTANAAKLSYVALSQFSNVTYGKNVEAVALGNNLKAYKYTDGKNTVTAVWSTSGNTTLNWNVENNVKIYDMYGNLEYVSANNGVAAIAVGSAPVYVVDYVSGDVNEDNTVNIQDLVRIKKNFVDYVGCEAMDVNEDYTLDTLDLVALREKLLNK